MSAPAQSCPPFVKSKKINLKTHPFLNEKWLQERLAEDPSLLGLGHELVGKEYKVPSGGRLDLLFKDSKDGTHYAVEVQLGAIDPSHLIRTIEYWLFLKEDGAKRVPVLVAEDFSGRFSNVVDAFKKPFDLIAIEVAALELDGGQVTLSFKTRIDTQEAPGEPADRAYWEKHAPVTLPLIDEIFKISGMIDRELGLIYNQNHISVAKNGENFLTFRAQKKAIWLNIRTAQTDELDAKAAVLGGEFKRQKYRLQLRPEEVMTQIGPLTELIRVAYDGWS